MPHSPFGTQERNCLTRGLRYNGSSDSRVKCGMTRLGGKRIPGPASASEWLLRDPKVTRHPAEPGGGCCVEGQADTHTIVRDQVVGVHAIAESCLQLQLKPRRAQATRPDP